MPAEADLAIARQWVAKAKNDLLNADNNLKAGEIPFDTVCFHCQQAGEKLLKAFLVAHGQPYPITHDLLSILEKVLLLNSGAEHLRDALVLLLPYAVEIRYPDDGHTPAKTDALEARQAAKQVFSWLEKAQPEIFLSPSSQQ